MVLNDSASSCTSAGPPPVGARVVRSPDPRRPAVSRSASRGRVTHRNTISATTPAATRDTKPIPSSTSQYRWMRASTWAVEKLMRMAPYTSPPDVIGTATYSRSVSSESECRWPVFTWLPSADWNSGRVPKSWVALSRGSESATAVPLASTITTRPPVRVW